ncbi:hypothetical protein JZ751_019503 [Albula glossodonta]|uniref:CNH domain-containing protein n=1 Tax=Albula glossodonta TaxID=121402 RepID=A0A8T2N0U6_9TELE|nr:hypothetical protein JZ751_019503 [Albula glossodonta]
MPSAAQNSQRGCVFLCGALESSVVLLQWYEPMHKFMLIKHFDFPLPSPLRVFEMLVVPDQEYPLVCIGVARGPSATQPVQLDNINLNSNTSWFYSAGAASSSPDTVQVNQLDSSTLLVLIEMFFEDTLLAVWRHGWQRRGESFSDVLQDVTDPRKAFRLVGSDRMVVLEKRNCEDQSGLSNLYILEIAENVVSSIVSHQAHPAGAVQTSPGQGLGFLCGLFVLKMAGDGGALKDINEIKSQFRTREGFYKLLTLSDSQQRGGITRGPSTSAVVGPGAGTGSIPGGGGGGSAQGPGSASTATAAANSSPAGFLPPVRVSMVKLQPEDPSEESERVCFNIGRELYFYTYTNIKKAVLPLYDSAQLSQVKGTAPSPFQCLKKVKGWRGRLVTPGLAAQGMMSLVPLQAVDLSKPIDKRIYKGTQPTCHDFNQYSATAESRLIDKSKVTCLKWLPKSDNLFLASHASGHLYLYNVEHPCGTAAPQYSLLRQGDGFAVYACKTKTPRNPLLRWAVGEGGLNEFAFSPDGVHVACVGQDGCLRVFHFDSMELQGVMKSYFGGLLCVSWSPDGKYLATGGEDDLVTVWSFTEGRVVARGHGHKSWVNVVAFDPFTTSLEDEEPMELSGSEEELQGALHFGRVRTSSTLSRLSRHSSKGGATSVTYRFGSVGQDTQFCLWDLTDDVLYPRLPLSRALTNTFGSTIPPSVSGGSNNLSSGGGGGVEGHHHPNNPHPPLPLPLPRSLSRSNSLPHPAVANASKTQGSTDGGTGGSAGTAPFSIGRFATLSLQERKSDKSGGSGGGDKEHKRYHSLGNISKSNDKINVVPRNNRLDAAKVLGTTLCPRMHEVPLLEPLVCKKIAHERLTVLVFMDDCIITACQEGLICTWARPGKANLTAQNGNSPSGTVV